MLCINISYIHVNQKVHREPVLTSFSYKKCTARGAEKHLNSMKSWYHSKQVILMMTAISCLARQTEIQAAQLSTVRITQKGLLATQEKHHLNFQKLTTNLVLRILTIFLKYQAQEAMKQISVQNLFLTLGN